MIRLYTCNSVWLFAPRPAPLRTSEMLSSSGVALEISKPQVFLMLHPTCFFPDDTLRLPWVTINMVSMQIFHFTPEAGGWTSNEATDSILWVGLTSDAQLLSRTTQPQYLASFFGISRCSDMDKGYQGKWKVELGIWHVRVLGKETHSEGCWDSTFFSIFYCFAF